MAANKKEVNNKPESARKKEDRVHKESLTTEDGHIMTTAESIFIDEYVKTGNARQSYLKAYPSVTPSSAAQNGYKLLNKSYIGAEIKCRLNKHKADSIAEADEILQYFTSVMRGEIKDQFGLDAPLGERTKAAQELAKRKIDIPNKLSGNDTPEVVIKVDWTRPNISINRGDSADIDSDEE